MVFVPSESNKRTILPQRMTNLHIDGKRNPAKLSELGLRNLYLDYTYYMEICHSLTDGILPQDIQFSVKEGPVALCGNQSCECPLFTECYFYLFKK